MVPPEEWISVKVSNVEGKSFGEFLAGRNLGVEEMLSVPVHFLAVVRRLAATNTSLLHYF